MGMTITTHRGSKPNVKWLSAQASNAASKAAGPTAPAGAASAAAKPFHAPRQGRPQVTRFGFEPVV